MRHGHRLSEITLKVPGPFAGVGDLGFSARYPEQSLLEPLRDVPLWIEGPATPMRRLAAHLRLLVGPARAAHAWTDPVMLTDEVAVMAFRDLSTGPGAIAGAAGPAGSAFDYVLNLVRPVVFPFLQDCAQVAHLRLEERIEIGVHHSDRPVAQLRLLWHEITPANGEDLLSA